MTSVRAAAGPLLLLAVAATGCRQCPAGGCGPYDVEVHITASPRPDWPDVVAPCLRPAARSWRVEVNPTATPNEVRVIVPAGKLRASRLTTLEDCLYAIHGVGFVDVPARL